MSTTIAVKPLNLYFSEVCDLSGQQHTSSTTISVASISGLDIKTINCASGSETNLLKLTATGMYASGNMGYFAVTNRDSEASVRLALSGSTSGYIIYLLKPGSRQIFFNNSINTTALSPQSGDFSYSTWDSISAVGVTAPVDVQTIYAKN